MVQTSLLVKFQPYCLVNPKKEDTYVEWVVLCSCGLVLVVFAKSRVK